MTFWSLFSPVLYVLCLLRYSTFSMPISACTSDTLISGAKHAVERVLLRSDWISRQFNRFRRAGFKYKSDLISGKYLLRQRL